MRTIAVKVVVALLLACAIPSTVRCADCIPRPSGLVSWWVAEGNATDWVGTQHGVLMNGVAFAGGIVGQALRFDGIDDYVANLPLGSVNNTFTIEFWALPSASRVSIPEGNSGIPGTSGQRYAIMPQGGHVYGENIRAFTGLDIISRVRGDRTMKWQPTGLRVNQKP